MFLIPIAIITLMYLAYRHHNHRRFGAVSMIHALYLGMSCSAIILYLFFDYDTQYKIDLEPMLYLSVCLIVTFYGIFPYSDNRIEVLKIDNWKLLKRLEWFQILTSSAAIIFYLPFAISGLSGNVADNRQNIQSMGNGLQEYGLLNSFFTIIGNLFVLSIVLSLINFATVGRGGSRLRGKILLLLSGVYIIYVLAYIGRDSFVYWLLTFLFIYLLLKDFIPRSEQKNIRKIFGAIAASAFIPFIVITFARFSGGNAFAPSDSNSVLFSIFDYAGQQIFNFNDQYMVDAIPRLGLINFGQIIGGVSSLLGLPFQVLDMADYYSDYTQSGAIAWRFPTFIGSWLQDFGRAGTVIAVTILALLTRLSLRKQARTGELQFSHLLYFIVLSQVLLFGVFYYRQYATSMSQITLLLIAFLFSMFKNRRSTMLITKKPILPNK